ncbi:hypothetical protein E3N88_08380 [Mikania micrantha]|uniref:AIR9-like A9 domain-containing protein n=1 Tax=Mikania micrantha TaxID=192012 RepID=A0A5N6PG43_9ASTR|nr:hypothetical protein E3N88_08380 [Mikania micrantha]
MLHEWARHYEDGTSEYIKGATNPEYVITADDVDKVIALECVPVDNQGRQGKVVRVFANDQKKISVASKKNYSKFQDLVTDDYQQPLPVSDADDSYDLEGMLGEEGLVPPGSNPDNPLVIPNMNGEELPAQTNNQTSFVTNVQQGMSGEEGIMMPGSAFKFVIIGLCILTAIKSQDESGFPFRSNPQTTMLAIYSVNTYGVASEVENGISAARPGPNSVYVLIAHLVKKLCVFQDLVTDDYQQPPPVSDAVDSYDLEDGPGTEDFMITGDPKPGRALRGSGYSVRGTIVCMFQWAHHYEDGTSEYIEGATNPEYVVTVDDVGKVIALECVPVDSQGRQGKVVRVFINDQKKITVDPGIEGLTITGDPKPGRALLGCGYAVRGTSTCMFQWVRHYEDGTSAYIEGAINPEYVVTADDVGKVIALECAPVKYKGRQGELMRVFANEQKKITCDPEMQQEIYNYMLAGQKSFSASLLIKIPQGLTSNIVLIRPRGSPLEFDFHDVRHWMKKGRQQHEITCASM